jgi:16S rRNA (guanine527-N7)-methyltransferase
MDVISKYFPDLSRKQKEQFAMLETLYREWNKRINVISRKDIDHLAERHILHSLAIAKIIRFLPGTQVIDVGTGGGFPGIPLAIFFPEVKFHLVDSIGKKIKVVNAISTELNLNNVTSEHTRVEIMNTKFDFIISRAVTRLPEFYQWVKHLISQNSENIMPNGILYLKGGDVSPELKPFKKRSEVYSLSDYFTELFFETKKIIYIPEF